MNIFVYDHRDKQFVRTFNDLTKAQKFIKKMNAECGYDVYNYLDGSDAKFKEYISKAKSLQNVSKVSSKIHNFDEIINDLKSFPWDLFYNSAQILLNNMTGKKIMHYRGYAVQMLVNHICNDSTFTIDTSHNSQMFSWEKHKVQIMLKSIFSKKFYGKNMKQKTLSLKLKSTFGTNNLSKPIRESLPDICLIVTSDAVLAVDKETVYERTVQQGDGFELVLYPMDTTVLYHNKNDVEAISSNLDVKSDIDSVISYNASRAVIEALNTKIG
jgi:hypothetical protein